MFWKGRITKNHFKTVTKLNKKPLKNSTFQLKSNFSEMFKKQFLIVIVLPGSAKIFCDFCHCNNIPLSCWPTDCRVPMSERITFFQQEVFLGGTLMWPYITNTGQETQVKGPRKKMFLPNGTIYHTQDKSFTSLMNTSSCTSWFPAFWLLCGKSICISYESTVSFEDHAALNTWLG